MAPRRIKIKPGKTQSKIGFIAGIIFVLIGCVVVIPIFGAFGIVWTIFAGVIAFMNYKNGFTEDGVTSHEIIVEDGIDVREDSEENIEDKLVKLNSLYEQRLITKEEYDETRKKILDDFSVGK